MNQSEFINNVVGLPWKNRAVSFESVDCWGLVLLYYKHVLKIDLPSVEGYFENDNVDDCWVKETKNSHWIESDVQQHGLVFTCYSSQGRPMHVGICIGGGLVLHADGHVNAGGTVRVNKIKSMQRLFGRVTYHKYVG